MTAASRGGGPFNTLLLTPPLRAFDDIGPQVPGIAARTLPAVIGAALAASCWDPLALKMAGVVLAVIAAATLRGVAVWALILFLAAAVLPGRATADWRFFVLLAGLHLLAVFVGVARAAPARGWVQLRVFRPPLMRFAAIQIPVQLVAAGAITLFGSSAPGSPSVGTAALGVVGSIALICLTVLLAMPLTGHGRNETRPRG